MTSDSVLLGYFIIMQTSLGVITGTKVVKISGGNIISWDQCCTCGSIATSRELWRFKGSVWWDFNEGTLKELPPCADQGATETQPVQLGLKRACWALSLARLGGATKPDSCQLDTAQSPPRKSQLGDYTYQTGLRQCLWGFVLIDWWLVWKSPDIMGNLP